MSISVTPKASASVLGNTINVTSWLDFQGIDVYPQFSQVSSMRIDLENESIRAALIQLGWTPPDK